MIVTIAKRFTFDAAHHLPNMPEGHKCRRHHGHTYEVELVLRGEPAEELGLFIDYADLAVAWAPLHERLDHQDLNTIAGLQRAPTTERIAEWILIMIQRRSRDEQTTSAHWLVWKYLHAVRVKESSSTWCEATVGDFLAGCEVVDG